jgi:hypothetical protein
VAGDLSFPDFVDFADDEAAGMASFQPGKKAATRKVIIVAAGSFRQGPIL